MWENQDMLQGPIQSLMECSLSSHKIVWMTCKWPLSHNDYAIHCKNVHGAHQAMWITIHIYLAVVFKSDWVREIEKHCVGQEMIGLCENMAFKSKYARCSFVSNGILKAFIHKQAIYSSKLRLWHMDEHRTHPRFQCQYCFAHPFTTDQYHSGFQVNLEPLKSLLKKLYTRTETEPPTNTFYGITCYSINKVFTCNARSDYIPYSIIWSEKPSEK